MLHGDRYTLRAVAEHIGTMPCSGHYVTWIVEQSSCICYNDSNVTRAESLPARIDQNATLVIYVRAAMLPAVSMQGAAQTHPPKEESNTAFAKNRLSCERLSQNEELWRTHARISGAADATDMPAGTVCVAQDDASFGAADLRLAKTGDAEKLPGVTRAPADTAAFAEKSVSSESDEDVLRSCGAADAATQACCVRTEMVSCSLTALCATCWELTHGT